MAIGLIPTGRAIEVTTLAGVTNSDVDAVLHAAATIVVQAQVAVEAKADAVFVPGNHDWNQTRTHGVEGRERIIEQGKVVERYVAERRAKGALPEGVEIRVLGTIS